MPVEPTAEIPISVWAGLPGFNWEVGNFFTLGSGDDTSDYFIMGTQFKEKDVANLASVMKGRIKPNSPGLPIWLSGDWMINDGKIGYQRTATGVLDYGWYYACNSFQDPMNGRRILWGWILDNDLSSMRRARNGWSGCMAIPRELTRLVIRNVVSTVSPGVALSDLDNCVIIPTSKEGDKEVYMVQTMGINPVIEYRKLYGDPIVRMDNVVIQGGKTIALGEVGLHWKMEMEVDIRDPTLCEFVVSLRHTPGESDMSEFLGKNCNPQNSDESNINDRL